MKLMASLFGFLALVLLGLTGCHELGHIDGPGDYGGISGNDLVGEVRNVDTRARQIELRTDAGRRELVRYDNNTPVVYRQQDYAASNLEPGDYVAVRGQQDIAGREVVLNGSRERCPPSIAAEGHSRCATATAEEFWSPFPLTHLARTEIVLTVYARAIRFGSKGATSTRTASTSKPSSEIACDYFLLRFPRARQ